MDTSLKKLNEIYEIDFDKIFLDIRRNNARTVLLQFPEGLKSYSQSVLDKIESNCNCECFIWLGTCFGACDVPLEVERLGVDMIIQFGHSPWK